METFAEPKALVESPRYSQDRQAALAALDLGSIDEPLVDLIGCFAVLPHCFTLQSCYGHFLCAPEQDLRSLDPVPRAYAGLVRYRIAYLILCIENSRPGRALLESLSGITAIDPDYVQFGSVDWFQERYPNSYALQVEPARFMTKDEAILEPAEALHVQRTRDLFFAELRTLVAREMKRS
jgi:hypothetical protein